MFLDQKPQIADKCRTRGEQTGKEESKEEDREERSGQGGERGGERERTHPPTYPPTYLLQSGGEGAGGREPHPVVVAVHEQHGDALPLPVPGLPNCSQHI
jgi:hypothetical protein